MCLLEGLKAKRKNKCFEEYRICRVYDSILNGEKRNFPPKFFNIDKTKKVKTIISYLVEDLLQITPEEALEQVTYETICEYKLKVLLKHTKDLKPEEEAGNSRYVKYLIYYTYNELPRRDIRTRIIDCYKEVLDGTRKKFPINYFSSCMGEIRAKVCFDYLITNILKKDINEAYDYFFDNKAEGFKILKKYKLSILLQILYSSVEDMVTSFRENSLN